MKFPAFPRLFQNRRWQSSKLHILFEQLRAAEAGLQQASGELEDGFLATSSELEVLADYSGQFVNQVQKLVGLATGNECASPVFSNAIQLIERAAHFLGGCQSKTDEMLGRLRNYNSQVEKLLGVEVELQHTMLPLQFVQTLFRVESARLDPGVQQMFGSLTDEIEALHGQVREIFGTKFKQLEQTHQTIGTVIEQLARQSESLRKLVSAQKVQIESSLAHLKQEMVSNTERDSQLGRLSQNLAQEVEQVVMGLQFQDIISQKVQHVKAALPAIQARFGEFKSAPNPPAANAALQFLSQSCRLESGQILAAETELAGAETKIQDGIKKVFAHLTDLDAHSLSLDEFKLLTTSFDGMVQVLVEMIEQVRNLVAATVASAAEAYELLQPLGSLASDLTTVVRDISTRIHLIGLNAQVQAARAAEDNLGTALEVLSARTSEISTETNRISQQAALQLDSLIGGLGDSVKAFGQLHADGLTQQGLLDQRGCAEEKALHAFRDSALETLRTIGLSLDRLQKQAERALATVKFDRFHQVTLPALQTPLEGIADLAKGWLQCQRHQAAPASLVQGFQRHYTMASERQVFREVTAGQVPVDPVPPANLPAADPEFELLHELPAAAIDDPLSMLEPGEKTVPLPLDAPPSGSAGLGANVDLF